MKKSESAGGVVINPDGLIAVVNQGVNLWSLPKGRVEKGETPADAARREVGEETGLSDYMLIRELMSYERTIMDENGNEDPSVIRKITTFLFTTPEYKMNPDGKEIFDVLWVEPREVTKYLRHRVDKEIYAENLNEILKFIDENIKK